MINKLYRLPAIPLQLQEPDKPPAKVQVIRVGTFHHPTYGKFEITRDHLLSFKKNFDEKVRGIDLALDFAHNSDGEAAAWFKKLELSSDGTQLWAETDWTDAGANAILGKRFRYVSADFNFDYEDNETLKKHGPTLLGAGLTNRPVVKHQAPVVELAEGKGSDVELEKEVTELKTAVTDIKSQLADILTKLGEKKTEDEGEQADEKKGEVAASEEYKKLEERVKLAEKKAADSELAQKNAEKKAQFDKQLSEGKVCEAQRDAFMKNDMVEFLAKAQTVKLSEQGSGREPARSEANDAETKVMELARKKLSEKYARNIGEAISMVLSENAELRKQYESQSA